MIIIKHSNLGDAAKAALRVYSITGLSREAEKILHDLTLYLKEVEKGKQTITVRRRKEMIIVILDINKIENKKTVEKINETKGSFVSLGFIRLFEMINKINKPMAKVPKEEKRKDSSKIRNGRGENTMNTTEIQKII